MESFVNKYRESVIQIRLNILNGNYFTANRLANGLTRIGIFLNEETYVFISEFLEYLTANITTLDQGYRLSDDDKNKISIAATNLIDFIAREIPISASEKELELLKIMKESRFLVTKMQVHYYTQKPKSRPIGYPQEFITETG